MEEMNGKFLCNHPNKPLKILLSQHKNENANRNLNNNDLYKLFVNVDKNLTKFELKNIFRVIFYIFESF